MRLVSITFSNEPVGGNDFVSAQVNVSIYIKSDIGMRQQVMRQSLSQELAHVEKRFSNLSINNLSKSLTFLFFKNLPYPRQKRRCI